MYWPSCVDCPHAKCLQYNSYENDKFTTEPISSKMCICSLWTKLLHEGNEFNFSTPWSLLWHFRLDFLVHECSSNSRKLISQVLGGKRTRNFSERVLFSVMTATFLERPQLQLRLLSNIGDKWPAAERQKKPFLLARAIIELTCLPILDPMHSAD